MKIKIYKCETSKAFFYINFRHKRLSQFFESHIAYLDHLLRERLNFLIAFTIKLIYVKYK